MPLSRKSSGKSGRSAKIVKQESEEEVQYRFVSLFVVLLYIVTVDCISPPAVKKSSSARKSSKRAPTPTDE